MADYSGKRAGNYNILQKLGDGGFATVYLAQHSVLEKRAAVKFLLEEWVNEADVVSRFFDEARTMERLKDHPNIVGIIDIASKEICEREGLPPYFVMDYVDGVSLEAKIHSDEGFTLEFILDVIKSALVALSHCHKLGVVHRDIKPSNILISKDGHFKLTDFGIAKAKVNTSKTGEGLTLGSTDYMSPEQALGKKELDHRSDIYSIGVTLYEMVTGKLPFIADNPTTVALMHIKDEPVPPIQVNDAVPVKLNGLIMKAMDKKPEFRFQSCDEMLDALADLNKPDAPVEAEVETVDLSKFDPEVPEDDIKEPSDGRKTSTERQSKIQKALIPQSVKMALRVILVILGVTILFLGFMKFYESYNSGQIALASMPIGAKVILSGKEVGTSPITLTLPAGIYKATFSFPGYHDNSSRVTVVPRAVVNLSKNLLKIEPDTAPKIKKLLDAYESAQNAPPKQRQNQISDALRRLEQTLNDLPYSDGAHNSFFELCVKNNLLSMAENYYNSKTSSDPKNVLYLVMVGKIKHAKGDANGALDTLSKAWDMDQNNINLLNALGDYFLKEKNPTKAKQYYTLSIFLDPDQTDVSVKLKEL